MKKKESTNALESYILKVSNVTINREELFKIVVEEVAKHYNIPILDIYSKKRTDRLPFRRHLIALTAYNFRFVPYDNIIVYEWMATKLGYNTHSGIFKSIKAVIETAEWDKELVSSYLNIRANIISTLRSKYGEYIIDSTNTINSINKSNNKDMEDIKKVVQPSIEGLLKLIPSKSFRIGDVVSYNDRLHKIEDCITYLTGAESIILSGVLHYINPAMNDLSLVMIEATTIEIDSLGNKLVMPRLYHLSSGWKDYILEKNDAQIGKTVKFILNRKKEAVYVKT